MSVYKHLFSWRKLNIGKKDLVLDVGCGGNPSIRADCGVDRSMKGIDERGEPLYVDRPFVTGDLTNLPFQDKSFDYIICSHVVEHADDIEAAFNEISRVGRRGYIETPNWVCESIMGWPFHKWVVDMDNNTNQLLVRKNNLYNDKLAKVFHTLQASNPSFKNFLGNNFDLFITRYEWSDKIEYKLVVNDIGHESVIKDIKANISTPTNANSFSFSDKRTLTSIRRYAKIYLRWMFLFVYGKRKFRLNDLLACPICKGKLQQIVLLDKPELSCDRCDKIYPIINGVPNLLGNPAKSKNK